MVNMCNKVTYTRNGKTFDATILGIDKDRKKVTFLLETGHIFRGIDLEFAASGEGAWQIDEDAFVKSDVFKSWQALSQIVYRVFFMQVSFDDTVHSIGLGFTDTVYAYAVARNKEEATALCTEQYNRRFEAKGDAVRVKAAIANDALLPFPSCYCFPEQMAGVENLPL